MLIGFLLSVAAGFFLQPYVAKLRWPKFEAKPEALHIVWEAPLQRAMGEYASSVAQYYARTGVVLTRRETCYTEDWWRIANKFDDRPFYEYRN